MHTPKASGGYDTSKSKLSSVKPFSPSGLSGGIQLGIDFTFNTIKNVQKVNYQIENPWYREIKDGFNWFCYCLNTKCKVNRQLVVLNRGYSILSLHKELTKSVCPLCKKGNAKGANGEKPTLIFRNCGFVNCEWVMRGIL